MLFSNRPIDCLISQISLRSRLGECAPIYVTHRKGKKLVGEGKEEEILYNDMSTFLSSFLPSLVTW